MIFVSKVVRDDLQGDTDSESVITTYALTPDCHFVTESYTDHLYTLVINGVTHYLRGATKAACLKQAYAIAAAHHDSDGQ
jgi:hypothetical protein